MDTGLLILRAVVGLLLVGHGTQKLFGWFGGYGLSGTGGFLESLRFRPGRAQAALAGLSEAGGGLLLALGLFTPLAGAAVAGTMVVATWSVHRGKGPWITSGGWEYNAVLVAAGLALAFAGPGGWSLDRVFELDLAGNGWGVAAVVTALFTATLSLVTRQPAEPVQSQAPAEETAQAISAAA